MAPSKRSIKPFVDPFLLAAPVGEALEYADKLIQSKLDPELTKEAAKILDDLYSPQTCWDKYVRADKTSDQVLIQEDDLDEPELLNVSLGKMAEVKDKLPKHVGQLFDLLLEVVTLSISQIAKSCALVGLRTC